MTIAKRTYVPQVTDYERLEDAYEKRVAERAKIVGVWMKQNKQAYFAEIARAFKEYERELTAILQTLKVAGIVDWDEAKPSPTLIRYQSMTRIEQKIVPYNSEPIIHKDSRTFPTAAVSTNYFRN